MSVITCDYCAGFGVYDIICHYCTGFSICVLIWDYCTGFDVCGLNHGNVNQINCVIKRP